MYFVVVVLKTLASLSTDTAGLESVSCNGAAKTGLVAYHRLWREGFGVNRANLNVTDRLQWLLWVRPKSPAQRYIHNGGVPASLPLL